MYCNKLAKLITGLSILLVVTLALVGCAPEGKVTQEGENEYPSRPINLIVPAGPGGATDLSARVISAHAHEIGVPMIVRNLPGAGMSIGIQHVVDADPDGYTILNATPFGFTHVPLSMPDDVQYTYEDIIPICEYAYIPYAIGINAKLAESLGIENWDDALAVIKENPGKYTYGHASITNSFWGLVLADAGYELVEVLHDGGGASASACAGGHVDFYGGSVGAVKALHEEGLVKVLITFPGEHIAGVPSTEDYPETYEILGLSQFNTCALFAPKGTPDHVIRHINASVEKMFEDEGFIKMIEKTGYPAKFVPHDEFKENLVKGYNETVKYKDILAGYGK